MCAKVQGLQPRARCTAAPQSWHESTLPGVYASPFIAALTWGRVSVGPSRMGRQAAGTQAYPEVPVNCTPREPHTWQQCLLLASFLKARREKAGPMWVAELYRTHLDKVV